MSDELSTLDRPLTLEEAAEYLQLPSRTVRELCTRKKVAHARLNYRNFRFAAGSVNDREQSFGLTRQVTTTLAFSERVYQIPWKI